ncbi:hypothetical protein D3C86_1549520 [compost metagenome]
MPGYRGFAVVDYHGIAAADARAGAAIGDRRTRFVEHLCAIAGDRCPDGAFAADRCVAAVDDRGIVALDIRADLAGGDLGVCGIDDANAGKRGRAGCGLGVGGDDRSDPRGRCAGVAAATAIEQGREAAEAGDNASADDELLIARRRSFLASIGNRQAGGVEFGLAGGCIGRLDVLGSRGLGEHGRFRVNLAGIGHALHAHQACRHGQGSQCLAHAAALAVGLGDFGNGNPGAKGFVKDCAIGGVHFCSP